MKCVYSTLFLDNWKLRKFQNESRMKQTVDAGWICISIICKYLYTYIWWLNIFSVRPLHVCSFNSFGQCEGLQL